MSLRDKTLFISDGSRGIGLQIALRAARDGANAAMNRHPAEPHLKLPGTVFTAAAKIPAAGGRALPIAGDIRDATQVEAAVAATSSVTSRILEMRIGDAATSAGGRAGLITQNA